MSIRLVVGVLLLSVCSSRFVTAQSPTPSPPVMTTGRACTMPTNVSVRPTAFRPNVPPTADPGLRRIDSLGSLVDTIIVQPDSLVLRVGESVAFERQVRIGRFRRDGELIPTSPTWFSIQDLSIAQFRPSGLTGLAPGLTAVVVEVFSNTPSLPAHAPLACVWVRVIP